MLVTLTVVVPPVKNFLESWKVKLLLENTLSEGFDWNVLRLPYLKNLFFFHFYVNIFRSTCRMTLNFSSVNGTRLGEHVRYLEHGRINTTREKFSRAMESQTFLEKTHFSTVLTRTF